MKPLLTLSARLVALAMLAVLAVGVLGGIIRLLPWLVAREVPIDLAVPFAKRLGRAALDTAILAGLPVGVATAAARFVDSGQSRCLMALGVSPERLVRPIAGIGAVAIAASVVTAFALGGDVDDAGAFATRLIERGRASCRNGTAPRADIPFVGAAWLCFPESPRLVGRVPGVGSEFVFSARDVTVLGDVSEVALGDVHVAGRARRGVPVVRARARSVHVTNLSSVTLPPSRMGGVARCLTLSVSAALAALALSWVIVRSSFSEPVHAAALAGIVAVAMVAALHELDRRATGSMAYLLLPIAGLATVFAGASFRRAAAEFWALHVARRGVE